MRMNLRNIYRRCIPALLIVLILYNMWIPVYAGDTSIRTVVPSLKAVNLKIAGDGKVQVEDQTYSASKSIQVRCYEQVVFSVIPGKNAKVKSILYNDKDITASLENNQIRLKGNAIKDRDTFSVVFSSTDEEDVKPTVEPTV
ncbi:MAG: hypothetical protein Q4B26_21035, partial [Eubacteriales bacterium]|nr:hypothetical protein [Eubacteriales bacterium]